MARFRGANHIVALLHQEQKVGKKQIVSSFCAPMVIGVQYFANYLLYAPVGLKNMLVLIMRNRRQNVNIAGHVPYLTARNVCWLVFLPTFDLDEVSLLPR